MRDSGGGMDLDQLFYLLIEARNSHDEEALQQAIDIVGLACADQSGDLTPDQACAAMQEVTGINDAVRGVTKK